MEQRYGDKVHIVFRDFPLSFHTRAAIAAEAAQCAHSQGKFWAYHDRLFENQKDLGDEALRRHASAVDLDLDAFDACMKANRFRNDVTSDMLEGQQVGVRGTPTIFVNGRLMGDRAFEDFVRIIEEELADSAAQPVAATR